MTKQKYQAKLKSLHSMKFRKHQKIWIQMPYGRFKARFWGYVESHDMNGDFVTYSALPTDRADVILFGGTPMIVYTRQITIRG